MSRVVNLTIAEAQVAAHCANAGIALRAIETLPSGGCPLVCATSEGAGEVRLRFQDHMIEGDVRRFPFYRKPWSQ